MTVESLSRSLDLSKCLARSLAHQLLPVLQQSLNGWEGGLRLRAEVSEAEDSRMTDDLMVIPKGSRQGGNRGVAVDQDEGTRNDHANSPILVAQGLNECREGWLCR